MNEVKLLGYLGKDFETDYTQNGICYAKNSLAITKKWKNKKGNEESKTTWIPIVLFGKNAENAFTYFSKGSQFLCSGELHSNEYTDKDGNKKMFLSVIVTKFYWTTKKSDTLSESNQNSKAQQEDAPKEPETMVYSDSQVLEFEQEDIPF